MSAGRLFHNFRGTTRQAKKVSSGIDRGMIDLQFLWMTTSGQSTKNKEITESQLNYVEDDFVRYDTRCYFNVRSKADISQLNLPDGTDN